MKIAIPHWQGRISPVFDVASRLLVIAPDGRQDVAIDGGGLHARVGQLVELRVELLICSAISGALEMAIEGAGIRVMAGICGPVDEVADAFMRRGRLDHTFSMPGCKRRRRRRGRHGSWR